MKKDEIKSLSISGINEKIAELRTELVKQNAQISTGTTPKSPGLVKQLKKNIARLLTAKQKLEVSKKHE